MYTPSAFTEADREVLLDLVDEYGFATLVSWESDAPMISHIPLLVDRSVVGQERLLGHVSRANEHWKMFDGARPALAMFQGPNGYVSPAWYLNHPSVPTWNYAVVHVYGSPRIVNADGTWSILQRLVEKHESSRSDRWQQNLPSDFVEEELHAIIGFEIPIDRLEGKFKLSQNKEAEDRAGALIGLERAPDRGSQELAEFTRRYFSRRNGI